MIVDLVFNLMIFIGLGVFSGVLETIKIKPIYRNLIQGLLFGLIIVMGMKYAYVFSRNTVIDCRALGVSISTLFFGPIAGLVTSSIAVASRFFLVGSNGLFLGVLLIFIAFSLAAFFHWFNKHQHKKNISLVQVWVLAFTLELVQLILFFFFKDIQLAKEAIHILSPMLIVVYPFGAVIVAYIIQKMQMNRDLTESLAFQENYYRQMFYHVKDLLMVVDNKKRLINMNNASNRITGFTEDELKGKVITDFLNLYDEYTDEKIPSALDKVISTKNRIQVTKGICIHSKSGETIPVRVNFTPIHFEGSDDIEYVFITGNDLRPERENKNGTIECTKNVFDHLDTAIIIMDKDKNILSVNEAGLKLFEVEKENFSKDIVEDMIKNQDDQCFNNLMEGQSQRFHYTKQMPNGKMINAQVVMFQAFYYLKKVVVMSLFDISSQVSALSELKQSLDNFSMLFQDLPSKIIFQGLDGTIMNISSEFAGFLGYTSNELVGKNMENIVNSVKSINLNQVMVDQKNNKDMEVDANCMTKDGKVVAVKMKDRLVRFSDGHAGILTQVCESDHTSDLTF